MRASLLSLVAALTLATTVPSLAQHSTDAPGDASKEGGVAGDPRGAIRALGGTTQGDFKQSEKPVDVPKLGGDPVGTGGPPRGTSGR